METTKITKKISHRDTETPRKRLYQCGVHERAGRGQRRESVRPDGARAFQGLEEVRAFQRLEEARAFQRA
jgi:hypothetical protein